jgi:hypothetical protein
MGWLAFEGRGVGRRQLSREAVGAEEADSLDGPENGLERDGEICGGQLGESGGDIGDRDGGIVGGRGTVVVIVR